MKIAAEQGCVGKLVIAKLSPMCSLAGWRVYVCLFKCVLFSILLLVGSYKPVRIRLTEARTGAELGKKLTRIIFFLMNM